MDSIDKAAAQLLEAIEAAQAEVRRVAAARRAPDPKRRPAYVGESALGGPTRLTLNPLAGPGAALLGRLAKALELPRVPQVQAPTFEQALADFNAKYRGLG